MVDGIQIFLQKGLIPADALSIRAAMDEAAVHGASPGICEAHFIATLYAVKAVALTFFSIVAYTVRAIASLVVDLSNGEIMKGLEDLGEDLLNAARLCLFSALGVVYVGIGFFLPETVYPYFLPELVLPSVVTDYDEVVAQNQKLRTQVEALGNREVLIGAMNEHRRKQLLVQEKLAETQASLSQSESRIFDLKKEIEGHTTTINAKTEDFSKLIEEKAKLEKDLEEALQKLQKQKAQFDQGIRELQESFDLYKTSSVQKIQALNRLIKQLESNTKTQKELKDSLQKQLEGKEKELLAREQEHHQLVQKLEEAKKRNEELKKTLQLKELTVSCGAELVRRHVRSSSLGSLKSKDIEQIKSSGEFNLLSEALSNGHSSITTSMYFGSHSRLPPMPKNKKQQAVDNRTQSQEIFKAADQQIEEGLKSAQNEEEKALWEQEKIKLAEVKDLKTRNDQVLEEFLKLDDSEQTEEAWRQLIEQHFPEIKKPAPIEQKPAVDLSNIHELFPNGIQNRFFDLAFTSINLWKYANMESVLIDDHDFVYLDGNTLVAVPFGEDPKSAIEDFIALMGGKIDEDKKKELRGKEGLTRADIRFILEDVDLPSSAVMQDEDVLIFDQKADEALCVRKTTIDPLLQGEMLANAKKEFVEGFVGVLTYTYGKRLAGEVIVHLGLREKAELSWRDIRHAFISIAARVRTSDLRSLLKHLDNPKKMQCSVHLSEEEKKQLRGKLFKDLNESELRLLERAFRTVQIGPIRDDISHALMTEKDLQGDGIVLEGRRIATILPRGYHLNLSPEELKKMHQVELWAKEIAYYNNDLSKGTQDGLIYDTPEGLFQVTGSIPKLNDAVLPYFYKPVNLLADMGPVYSLVMTFRGTDPNDGMSLLRDLDLYGIGFTTFNRRKQDLRDALLEQLRNGPKDKQVTLKIYGHSLGAVDTQRMLAFVLELIVEREAKKEQLAQSSNDEALIQDLEETVALDKIYRIEIGGENPPAPEYAVSKSVFKSLTTLKLSDTFKQERKLENEGESFVEIIYGKFDGDAIQTAGDRLAGAACTTRDCTGCSLPLATRTIYHAKDPDFTPQGGYLGPHMSKAFTGSKRYPRYQRIIVLGESDQRNLDYKLSLDKWHSGYDPNNSLIINSSKIVLDRASRPFTGMRWTGTVVAQWALIGIGSLPGINLWENKA